MLSHLITLWSLLQVHEKIVELQSQTLAEDVKSHKAELTDISKYVVNP